MADVKPETTAAFRPDQAWESVDADDLAGAVIATWQTIDAELASVVGARGVAAMYQRSLQLSARQHAWLAAAQGDLAGIDFGALEREIDRQPLAEAVAGARSTLQAFHELLVSMVGADLTGKILRSVRTGTPGASPVQGSSA